MSDLSDSVLGAVMLAKILLLIPLLRCIFFNEFIAKNSRACVQTKKES